MSPVQKEETLPPRRSGAEQSEEKSVLISVHQWLKGLFAEESSIEKADSTEIGMNFTLAMGRAC